MKPLQGIAEQLDVARRLMDQKRLDVVEALAMLNALPPGIRDEEPVTRAREAVSAVATGIGQHLIVARFALARVIVMLEERMAQGV